MKRLFSGGCQCLYFVFPLFIMRSAAPRCTSVQTSTRDAPVHPVALVERVVTISPQDVRVRRLIEEKLVIESRNLSNLVRRECAMAVVLWKASQFAESVE